MKLTVDCVSTGQLFSLPKSSGLAYLLSKADLHYVDLPLEALICEEYRLMPVPDYPIATLAAVADGIDVGKLYWLRADPVHLVLQRDSFALSEPCPLLVSQEHAQAMMLSLNQHFKQDGLNFCLGNSGAWYVGLAQAPQVKTVLPAIALGKNIANFMPQGLDASRWVAYLNEIQMLLHDHAANNAREQLGDVAVNSVWFSGGGSMQDALSASPTIVVDVMLGQHVFYQGLAQSTGVVYQKASASLQDTISLLAEHSSVRLQLTDKQLLEDSTFQTFINQLRSAKISQLIINLACYDKTIVARIKPLDLYKFWRKTKSMSDYLL